MGWRRSLSYTLLYVPARECLNLVYFLLDFLPQIGESILNVIFPNIALKNGAQLDLEIFLFKLEQFFLECDECFIAQFRKRNAPPKQEFYIKAVPDLSAVKKGRALIFHGLFQGVRSEYDLPGAEFRKRNAILKIAILDPFPYLDF